MVASKERSKVALGIFLLSKRTFATWGRKLPPNKPAFTQEELCKMIDLLIDNIYFTVGPTVFRQNIGIPMGTDCAPYMANLFLHYHEDKFISSNRPKKWHLCEVLSHNKRYIDDMLVVNAGDLFDQVKDDIYPKELVLNKESEKTDTVHFLDMNIAIKEGAFCISLYDKRDNFPFKIVNFPFLDGNVPLQIGTSVIISQLVRFSKCSLLADFLKVAGKLFQKVRRQFFSQKLIAGAIKRFLKNHFDLVVKYGVSKKTLTLLLFH